MAKLTRSFAVPLVLLLVTAAAFGPLIPRLGFYWDDWAKILVARLWSLGDYLAYYAEDRPLSAWTHWLFTPLLGTTPLPWHAFTLLLRWLSGWALAWLLGLVWPTYRRQNFLAALLFLVHPAFISQPAAVTFHQQWLQMLLLFLSWGAMLSAQRARLAGQRRAFWVRTALALAALLAQISITEYFIPLDLLRPLLLWFLLAPFYPARPERLRQTLAAWAVYLLPLAAYSLYRLFFVRLPGADPYRANTLFDFLAAPLATLQKLAGVVLTDLYQILVSAWVLLPRPPFDQLPAFTLLAYALAAATAVLAAAAWLWLRFDDDPAPVAGQYTAGQAALPDALWVRQAAWVGLAAVLLGPVPAWVTGRQVLFDFHSDRYAMPALFGAALLLAAGVLWLANRPRPRAVLAAALVFLAVSYHLQIANQYRWVTVDEQRTFWQLAWRAPGLKAPTALYFETEPFPNQGLFSISAALNQLYPQAESWLAVGQEPPDSRDRLAFWVYTLRPRYTSAPPDLMKIGHDSTFRSLHFEGATPNSLFLYKNPQRANCLWVLRPQDENHPYLPDLVKAFLPISNLERIVPQPLAAGFPPADQIGPEPGHNTWCYLFERADLARQLQDWPAAAALYDEAVALGYSPAQSGANSPYEWLPFVTALAAQDRSDEAAALSLAAQEQDRSYTALLCQAWDEAERPPPAALGCSLQP